ncbi:2-amino-3-ketobutyrate coenzyme A ligase [compost metagenome]
MHASNRQDWMSIRRSRTTDALAQATSEGLTGFTVAAREGKQVTLADGQGFTEFVSCSYLGLENHPALIDAAKRAMVRTGLHLSSSRGAMRPVYLEQLEALLAQMYPGSAVCVFSSTSSVHLGVLPLLGSGSLPGYRPERPVHWLMDKTAHASMQVLRGVLEQFGQVVRVDCTRPGSLEQALHECKRLQRTPILLVDGIGSMSGLVPVAALCRELESAGGFVYVDDAHGISIVGKHGCGYAFTDVGLGLPKNLVLTGSLSKAFGGAGGFAVVSGLEDVKVISTSANPLVFGHSIMVPMLAANVAAALLHLSPELAVLQNRLWANVSLFDALTDNSLMNAGVQSPVRGALFANEEAGLAAARLLRDDGFLVFPVFYPIVPQGQAMLRFAVSSEHTQADIRRLATTLREVSQRGLQWLHPDESRNANLVDLK